MRVDLLLLIGLLWQASAFLRRSRVNNGLSASGQSPGAAPSESANSGFQLVNVHIPVQSDPSAYVSLLHQLIPKEKLLRWYISEVVDGQCTIDAVVIVKSEEGGPSKLQ